MVNVINIHNVVLVTIKSQSFKLETGQPFAVTEFIYLSR